MSTSAFFVAVPEAEPSVGALRERYDPAALVGIPAHITVLYPFMPRDHLTDAVLERARAALSAFSPFAYTLARIARFPQTTYLAPEPAERFESMTAALAREFPDCRPYGGRYERVIPHLTVADQSATFADAAEHALTAIMRTRGPIQATCTMVEIYENSDAGRWKPYDSFPLSAETINR